LFARSTSVWSLAAPPATDSENGGAIRHFWAEADNPLAHILDGPHSTKSLGELSPIVLYGAPRVGKSLLARALVYHLERSSDRPASSGARAVRNPGGRVRHAPTAAIWTSFDFRRRVTAALETRTLGQLFAQILAYPCWVLDDLDELAASRSAQERMIELLDKLAGAGRLVLITCRGWQRRVEWLDARLASRLSAGLAVHISPASLEVRREIIQQLARDQMLTLDAQSIDRLAGEHRVPVERLATRIRHLGGPAAAASLEETPRSVSGRGWLAQMELLGKLVARSCKVRSSDLCSASRRQRLVRARGIVTFIAREHLGLSWSAIGRWLGNRDQSTVRHAYQAAQARIACDAALAGQCEDLATELLAAVKRLPSAGRGKTRRKRVSPRPSR
jgi:chromosomal replication initiation ATPase DnaA